MKNHVLAGLGLMALAAISARGFAQDEATPGRFHHVHLNVMDPDATIKWYTKHFGAVQVKYQGLVPSLFSERSFFLLNQVDSPPPWEPHSALSHIGWSTNDGPSAFEWMKEQGVDIETPIGQLGNNYGMYFYGPDKELVEIWTGSRNHRFEHLHLWATDVPTSANWFKDNIGVTGNVLPKPTIKDSENIAALQMAFLQSDNVNLIFFGRPDFESRWWPGGSYKAEDAPKGDFEPTQGRTIDHIAFSYRDIDPVFDRMKASGVEIEKPITKDVTFGHRSFFVWAPDGLLVEIVEAKPIPDGSWE